MQVERSDGSMGRSLGGATRPPLRDDRSGVTAVEYGLIGALIAGALIGVLTALDTDILAVLNIIGNTVSGV